MAASYLLPDVSVGVLDDFKACGGLITLAVGLKIAGIKSMHILNFVPALLLVFIFKSNGLDF